MTSVQSPISPRASSALEAIAVVAPGAESGKARGGRGTMGARGRGIGRRLRGGASGTRRGTGGVDDGGAVENTGEAPPPCTGEVAVAPRNKPPGKSGGMIRLVRSGFAVPAADAETPDSTSTTSEVLADESAPATDNTAGSEALAIPVSGALFANVDATLPQNCNALMWHAIVKGDLDALKSFVALGVLTTGRLLDTNGHTIFWNAVAFQQPAAALWLLQEFPPEGGEGVGVDLSEVHARRGDSLVHLCLYMTDFTAQAAELFRIIFLARSKSNEPLVPYRDANKNGQNFLHVAAARLNFWVIHFALANCPKAAALFHNKDNTGYAPADILLHRTEEVTGTLPFRTTPPPPPWPRAPMPSWCPFSQHRPRPCSAVGGAPPAFADVALEVEDRAAEGGVARTMAHRVVLAANSRILDSLVRGLALGGTLRLDGLCCRSGVVLDSVLTFLYSGELTECSFFSNGFLLWQLLCLCAQYALPPPLTNFARRSLLRVLRDKQHAAVVPVLLQASDHVGLTLDETTFVACTYLTNLGLGFYCDSGAASIDKVEVLLAALIEVERFVLTPVQMPPSTPDNGSSGAAAALASHHAPNSPPLATSAAECRVLR